MQTEYNRTYTDSNTINKELYKSIAQKKQLELVKKNEEEQLNWATKGEVHIPLKKDSDSGGKRT